MSSQAINPLEGYDISVAKNQYDINPTDEVKNEFNEADLEAMLPKPVGYKILIALPDMDDAYDSGIIKSTKTLREEYILSNVGLVIDIGEQAYNDKERFPTGAWCKLGDYVIFRANTGTRLQIQDKEYRLMNDDSIEAVVSDPKGVKRPY
jgi:co-chaperonin GroES (HSP10)